MLKLLHIKPINQNLVDYSAKEFLVQQKIINVCAENSKDIVIMGVFVIDVGQQC